MTKELFAFKIERELREKLEQLAVQLERSKGDVCRIALKEFFKNKNGTQNGK